MTFSVEAQHISMIYQSSAGQKVQALDDISFQIPSSTWAALAGSSGSGKSSLLHILGGLLTPTGGSLEITGFALHAASSNERSAFRLRNVGFVFQAFYLLPHLRAWENVALPLIAAGEKPKERKERAFQLLDEVGLAGRYHHRPAELSGGEQQRVALARAIVHHPAVILADEPTGNLDAASAKLVLDILENFVRQGATVICATHDPKVTNRADQVIQLEQGKIVSHV